MNPLWSKWITASINKYFKNKIHDDLNPDVLVFLINQDPTNTLNRVEIRLGGPEFTQLQGTSWKATFDLDLLISVQPSDNIYNLEVISGQIASYFTTIPIYTLGDGDILLGCTRLLDRVRIIPWGQPKLKESMAQTSVEGSFELLLEE